MISYHQAEVLRKFIAAYHESRRKRNELDKARMIVIEAMKNNPGSYVVDGYLVNVGNGTAQVSGVVHTVETIK